MLEFVIFMYLIISIISAVLFVMLLFRILNEEESLITIKFTKIMLVLLFFIFLDSFFSSLTYFLGLTSHAMFYSNEIIQIISKAGIFLSIAALAHFIHSKHFDQLKKKETSVNELIQLNKQLEERTKEMEAAQKQQEKKLEELERFNEIARQREAKMMKLLKKIDKIEGKMKK